MKKIILLALLITISNFGCSLQKTSNKDAKFEELLGDNYYRIEEPIYEEKGIYLKDTYTFADYKLINEFVYYNETKIQDANIEYFKVYENGCASSDFYIDYYKGKKLTDYQKFKSKDQEFIKNRCFIYNYPEMDKFDIIEDIESFEKINDVYYKDKNGIYYISDIQVHKINIADLGTFIVLNQNDYAKDKNHAYYDGKIIESADPQSFEFINGKYTKDKNHVFYYDEIIFGANPKTFKLVENSFYKNIEAYDGKDNNNIYINGVLVDGVDVNAFEIIKGSYVKDKDSVYYENAEIQNADVATFEVVEYKYSKDANFVYYGDEIIENADSSTFQVVEFYRLFTYIDGRTKNTLLDGYAKDKNHVYYNGKIIEDVDASSFEILDYFHYTKDKNHVYLYRNQIIENADAKSFKVLGDRHAKDKNYIYHTGKIIEGADHNSFEEIDWDLSKDKNYVYHFGTIVEGADPRSFEVLRVYDQGSYAKDKKYIYGYSEESISKKEDMDLATFQLLEDGWGRDKNNLYNYETKIEGVDFKTLKIINLSTAMDKNAMYHAGIRIEMNLRK